MTPRERLVSVREGATLAEGKALMHTREARARARRQRRLRAARPDDRQGHHQADRASPTPRATRTASCASAPRSASATAPRSAPSCWCAPASTCSSSTPRTATAHGVVERVRWVKRNFPNVDVIGGNIATGAGRARPGRGRRRRGQGRHRPGLDLHDAHRRRRRRAADHGDRRRRQGARRQRRAADRRRRRALLGRHRQGDRRRRRHRDDGRRVRRHRGGAGRGRSSTRAARYKSYRGMGSIGAMQQGSADRYFQEGEASTATRRQARAGRHRGPRAVQGLGRRRSSSRWSAACAPRWATAAARSIAEMHEKAEFVEITVGRHPREPRPRRADHEGSAELPRRMTSMPRPRTRRRRRRPAPGGDAVHHGHGADRHGVDRPHHSGAAGAGRQLHRRRRPSRRSGTAR